MRRPARELQVFSISALDLFASAMGTFILIAVVLFPYYLKEQTTVRELKKAQADNKALKRKLQEAEARAREAEARARKAQEAARKAREAARKARQKLAARPKPKPTPTPRGKVRIPGVDVVYVIDTTASMGEGVNQVRSSLVGIVRILREMADDVRVGFVAYKARDGRTNEYVMISRDLASTRGGGLSGMRGWVSRLRPQGGGTEIMLEAVRKANSMAWRRGALNVIILVADEPGAASDLPGLLALARRFGGARWRISAFLPPMRTSGMGSRQRTQLQRQRAIVRRWMAQITRAGRGLFVPPEEGDLASATLLTVRERMRP